MRKNPYKELAKLPPKQRAKFQQDLITAKKTIVYRVKGFKDKNFNIKDIYMYNPTKHIALIQTKSSKAYLLVKNLVYIKYVGYGELVENFEKCKDKAMEGYWKLTESIEENLDKYEKESTPQENEIIQSESDFDEIAQKS